MGATRLPATSNPNAGRKVYAVFCGDGRTGVWWDAFTRNGFRHVFGIVEDVHGAYAMVDYSRGFLETFAFGGLTDGELRSILDCWPEAHLALDVAVPAEVYEGQMPIPLWSCVSMVKAQIGMTAPLVLTPYQLYNKLLSQGSTEFWRKHG